MFRGSLSTFILILLIFHVLKTRSYYMKYEQTVTFILSYVLYACLCSQTMMLLLLKCWCLHVWSCFLFSFWASVEHGGFIIGQQNPSVWFLYFFLVCSFPQSLVNCYGMPFLLMCPVLFRGFSWEPCMCLRIAFSICLAEWTGLRLLMKHSVSCLTNVGKYPFNKQTSYQFWILQQIRWKREKEKWWKDDAVIARLHCSLVWSF